MTAAEMDGLIADKQMPHRRSVYEGRGGWKDGRLGQAYDLVDAVRNELEQGSEARSMLNALQSQIENADAAFQKGFEE